MSDALVQRPVVQPHAVARARTDGWFALCRSVFDPLPRDGRWRTALLADGDLGIGGDPVRLLRRCRRRVRPGGVSTVEVEPPDTRLKFTACFGDDRRSRGERFGWARPVASVARRIAGRTGFGVLQRWSRAGRRLLALRRAAP